MKPVEHIQMSDYLVNIVRTSRKNSALLVVKQGDVSVRVSKNFPIKDIQKFIQKQHTWIINKIEQQQQSLLAHKKHYVDGEQFDYLGKKYPLKITKDMACQPRLHPTYLEIFLKDAQDKDKVRQTLLQWYEQQATQLICEKVQQYGKKIGVAHTSIRFRDYKSRWGACSNQGALSFNWRLIMAPNFVIDYVVIHELCHLIHQNHAPAFWREVERFMPEYETAKRWLKNHGNSLVV